MKFASTATGSRDLVEDLAQETFLRVFRGLRYFDARAKLSTWVYAIAHRVVIDHLRQVRLKPDTTYVEPSSDVVSGFSRTAVAPERNPEAATADEELDAITSVAGAIIVRTTPLLVANEELVAWMGAAAGLLIAAAVTGLAQEWI